MKHLYLPVFLVMIDFFVGSAFLNQFLRPSLVEVFFFSPALEPAVVHARSILAFGN